MNKLYFSDNLDILKDLKNEHPDLPHFSGCQQTVSLSLNVIFKIYKLYKRSVAK
jgi:hypothetical protein